MLFVRIIGKCALSASFAWMLSSCSEQKPASAPNAPPQVVVQPARMIAMTPEQTFAGRIRAIQRVDLRARIQGVVTAKHAKDGAHVKKGELLLEIDHAPLQAAVDLAQANLDNAKAQQVLAQQTYNRQAELKKETFATAAAVDAARAQLLSSEAAIQARSADLEMAKINLSYSYIVASIDGKIGRIAASVGDIVSPTSAVLTTLVQDDPIYAIFPVPSKILLALQRTRAERKGVNVRLILADGSSYEHIGQMAFAEVAANPSTDSLSIAATFPNPNSVLVDGQLVNVEVVAREQKQVLAAPQAALMLDQLGAYMLGVDADNKVVQRRIKTGEQIGADIVVLEGLSAGEAIIVEGQLKARVGAVVQVQPGVPPAGASTPPVPNAK